MVVGWNECCDNRPEKYFGWMALYLGQGGISGTVQLTESAKLRNAQGARTQLGGV